MTVLRSLIIRRNLVLPLLALGFSARIAPAQTDAPAPASVKFTTLHTFSGADGALPPQADLVQATNGDIYGTTARGGTGIGCIQGCGTIFKMTPDGALTTLYSFCSQLPCADGQYPEAGLTQATNGDLYGTTIVGGASQSGTVFRITPRGALTTLHNFATQTNADGQFPSGLLVQAANGDLYGTTENGGSDQSSPEGGGTIFKITPSGTLTTLYSFCSQTCADGLSPFAGLVQAANGDLYGTTVGGGLGGPCPYNDCGTVFKITPGGMLSTLYSFCSESGCVDGDFPISGVLQASNGDLWGTTELGGTSNALCLSGGCGTIFKITPTGTLTTVYSFCPVASACPDGYAPGALVRAASGSLYGITLYGGSYGQGTIFKITSKGNLTTLYSFCSQSGCPDGAGPSSLIQATDGVLYGTTFTGGGSAYCPAPMTGCGTIFALSTGEAPFVETRPVIGKAGEAVTILGYKLTGTTSVTFNGISAAFAVRSSTEISTIVPAGATTGEVQVITPDGALSSNIAFEVAP
jgi:uncharacterized repeat protein (TIGR03803 family)